jgi:hypothetical protein
VLPLPRAASPLRLECGFAGNSGVFWMSKLGCGCGHVIRDQADNLPYKGHVLLDVQHATFFDWLARETQSYVEAARAGAVEQWLLGRGYTQDYVALKLSHGDVLGDRIHARFCELKRDLYECEGCGRLHMETAEDNRFVGYAPDNGKVNAVLAGAPSVER